MVGTDQQSRGILFPRRTTREVAVFVAVVALLIDGVFFLAWTNTELERGGLAIWGIIKVSVVVAGVGWLAWDIRAWSLGLIAMIFALIGLEDAVGVTAPLGLWLIEERGLRTGRNGANIQLLRRGLVTVTLLGPTLYVATRAPGWLRKAVWVLIGFLGAIFLAAVLGDVVADRTDTNLDELLEEPLLSLCVGFVVGLVAHWWPRRQLNAARR